MSLVETTCPRCQVAVLVPADEIRAWCTPRGAYFAFVCPQCNDPAANPMSPRHLAALRRIGTPIVPDADDTQLETVAPERFLEPEAPALAWDDLIEFHDLLQTPDWFERLVDAGS